jgi:hypothetical protein
VATTFPIRAQTDPAVKDINQLIAALRKTGKEAGMSEKEINDMVDATKKGSGEGVKNINKMNESMGGFGSTITKVGGVIATVFALDRIKQFIGQIVTVTAEFQKLEAVLTNTLGSRGAAQRALADIQAFAARTPFSVLQLTDSFVKLVNQGFKPTQDEMRKLGDIASSQAKGFDQLTEAIIDAQTGEFERLKEFGIRASKEGDKVTFTFKGVQTQTEFTSESIRQYILSLGDAEGVSGSMAAISETLSGKISNLGDSWDKLLTTIGSGEAAQRGTNRFLTLLSQLLGDATDLVITEEQKLQASINDFANQTLETYKNSGRTYEEYLAFLEKEVMLRDKQYYATLKNKDATFDEIDAQYLALQQAKGAVFALREYNDELNKQAAIKEKSANDKEFAKAQEAENKRVKELADAYKKLTDSLARFIELDKLQRDARIGAIDFNSLGNVGFNNPATGINVGDLPAENVPEIAGLRSLEDIESQKQELRQQTFDQAISLGNALFDFYQNQTRRELDLLKGRYDYEIFLAGDNEEAKRKIAKDFQAQQATLINKQNEQQKQQAIFQILVNQGPAVAKTISTVGFPAALPLLLLVAAQFGLLLGNQRKVEAPRYAAKGDFDIDGPGTETSDSIPYWLSKRETVTPAHATKKFGELLKPMLDPNFTWADVKSIVDRKLPSRAADAIVMQAVGGDSRELIDEFKAFRKAVINKRETHLHLDENGFSVFIGSGQSWSKYASKRYSS